MANAATFQNSRWMSGYQIAQCVSIPDRVFSITKHLATNRFLDFARDHFPELGIPDGVYIPVRERNWTGLARRFPGLVLLTTSIGSKRTAYLHETLGGALLTHLLGLGASFTGVDDLYQAFEDIRDRVVVPCLEPTTYETLDSPTDADEPETIDVGAEAIEPSRDVLLALCDSGERFPVDFDDAWPWLEYSRKDNAKAAFAKCGFVEGLDFSCEFRKTSSGGRPVEKLYLTIECFLSFCMMAATAGGKRVRQHMIAVREEWLEMKRSPSTALGMSELASAIAAVGEGMKMISTAIADMKDGMKAIAVRVENLEADRYTNDEGQIGIQGIAPVPLRTKCNEVIRRYCHHVNLTHSVVWNEAYTQYKRRYGFDVYSRQRNATDRGEKLQKLDIIEDAGKLPEFFGMLSHMFSVSEPAEAL